MVYSLVCCTWTAYMCSWASTLRYHPKLWSDVISVSYWKFKLSIPWSPTIGLNTIFKWDFWMHIIWLISYESYGMIIWLIWYGQICILTYSGGFRLFESGWSPSGIKWLSTSVLIFVSSKLINLLLFSIFMIWPFWSSSILTRSLNLSDSIFIFSSQIISIWLFRLSISASWYCFSISFIELDSIAS